MRATERMDSARKASSEWSRTTPADRVRLLRPLRHAITRNLDSIIDLLVEETGKTSTDALTGDVMVTLEHLRFCEKNAPHVLRERNPGKSAFIYSGASFAQTFEPHGVVLVFAPWNYPLQLAAVPAITALYAGNSVLLKCSERTPRIARLIAQLCEEARLPENLVQVSCEPPEQAAALLEAGPDFFFFTGSSRAGKALLEKAAALLVPAAMELGGNHPALVFDSCNLERTVDGLTYGAFANSGQMCCGVKRIYVQHTIYERFLPLFMERTRALSGTDLGRLQNGDHSSILAQLDALTTSGATVHDCANGWVVTDPPRHAVRHEEVFGPIVSIAPFHDEAEAVHLANDSHLALTASVWSADNAQAQRVAQAVTAGAVSVNDVIRNVGNPYAAFGGNRSSGFGRYHGAEGLMTFSRTRSIMSVSERKQKEIHWFPHETTTYERLRRLMLLRHADGSLVRRIGAFLSGKGTA